MTKSPNLLELGYHAITLKMKYRLDVDTADHPTKVIASIVEQLELFQRDLRGDAKLARELLDRISPPSNGAPSTADGE